MVSVQKKKVTSHVEEIIPSVIEPSFGQYTFSKEFYLVPIIRT